MYAPHKQIEQNFKKKQLKKKYSIDFIAITVLKIFGKRAKTKKENLRNHFQDLKKDKKINLIEFKFFYLII